MLYRRRGPRGNQTGAKCLENHADAIITCDFCTVITMNFGVLYILVLIELGTMHLIHTDVAENPTADWAVKRLREAISADHEYRYLIHNGDCIFSAEFDRTVCILGIKLTKALYRHPKANAICKRMIRTVRRECLLDYAMLL